MLLFFLAGLLTLLPARESKWGWTVHRYINEQAVNYLPPEMAFFLSYQTFLRDHAVDPDQDDLPGQYHYIDIDVYPEFFNGTLPHKWDEIIALYGYNYVFDTGIVPWIIEQWSDSLTSLMRQGKWNDAWQVAAELGHYVADSHQPLHLTENYNGWMTGNGGIHSRYETQMITPYLTSLSLPQGQAEFWTSPIDSVFSYIDHLYPYVADIMAADDAASTTDPGYGSVYYSNLWQLLEGQTTDALHRAILDLASIWYSAWVNAGSPNPTAIGDESDVLIPADMSLRIFPNPFNPSTNIQFTLSQNSAVQIEIHTTGGRRVYTLFQGNLAAGTHSLRWQPSGMSSGVYLVTIRTEQFNFTRKVILLR